MHTQHSRAHQQGFLLLLLLVLLFKIPFTLRAGNRCCVPEFCTPRLIVTCRDLVSGPARVCFVYLLLDCDHFTRQLPSNHCFGVEGLSATVPHTHTLIKHQRESESKQVHARRVIGVYLRDQFYESAPATVLLLLLLALRPIFFSLARSTAYVRAASSTTALCSGGPSLRLKQYRRLSST